MVSDQEATYIKHFFKMWKTENIVFHSCQMQVMIYLVDLCTFKKK